MTPSPPPMLLLTPWWKILGIFNAVIATAAFAMSVVVYEVVISDREGTLETICREENARHDRTIAELDRQIAGLPPGARKRRAERSRDFTVALIAALSPKRDDCAAYARQLVR